MSRDTPLVINNITGAILAGGQSRRMGGGDKFLNEIDGKTILQLIIDRFSTQCPQIILSANGNIDRFNSYNLPIVTDPIENYAGPLAGILAAMNWTVENRPSCSHILSVAADSPLFPDSYTQAMIDHANRIEPDTIILATSRGWHHPIFGLWPLSLRDNLDLQLHEGLRKIRAWTDSCSNSTLDFSDITINDEDIDPFFNINEPKELEVFKRLKQSSK